MNLPYFSNLAIFWSAWSSTSSKFASTKDNKKSVKRLYWSNWIVCRQIAVATIATIGPNKQLIIQGGFKSTTGQIWPAFAALFCPMLRHSSYVLILTIISCDVGRFCVILDARMPVKIPPWDRPSLKDLHRCAELHRVIITRFDQELAAKC